MYVNVNNRSTSISLDVSKKVFKQNKRKKKKFQYQNEVYQITNIEKRILIVEIRKKNYFSSIGFEAVTK